MKAARTSLKTFSKQSFTDDGRVPVGGDLPHGHAHRFRLDPTLRGAREGLVGAYGRLWSVGDVVEQWLHTPSGRLRILGGGCQCCDGPEALGHIALARTIAAEAVELPILRDGTGVRLAGCYRRHVVQDPLEEIANVRARRACASPELPLAVLGCPSYAPLRRLTEPLFGKDLLHRVALSRSRKTLNISATARSTVLIVGCQPDSSLDPLW